MENVAIIGASSKEDRYAYKAQKMLLDHGHNSFPVNPYGGEALGESFYKSINDIGEDIDTVTLYVAPKRLEKSVDDIIAKKPKRIIFNPGTESSRFKLMFEEAGIETLEACTLVLLSTNQF